MLTCSKSYIDVPFAHRQHRHTGQCSFIHGHNWSITLTFACRSLDANGFVVDFGNLRYIRDWILEHLDHACLFNEDDPDRESLVNALPGAWKVYTIPCCSAEGIATHLYSVFDPMVRRHTGGRAWVRCVEVREDSRNAALYEPDQSGSD